MGNETHEHALEYICIQCWKGFHGAEADQDDAGALSCPHCGTLQPSVDEILAADFSTGAGEQPDDGAPSERPMGSIPAAPKPEPDAPPHNVVPLNRGGGSASPPVELDAELGPDSEEGFRESVLSIDPNNAAWRLRSSIGITYNFPGWDAMLRWAGGRSSGGPMAVSVLGVDVWKDFGDLRSQLGETPDPRMAFLLARPFEADRAAGSSAVDRQNASLHSAVDEIIAPHKRAGSMAAPASHGKKGRSGDPSSGAPRRTRTQELPASSAPRSKGAETAGAPPAYRPSATRQQARVAALFFGLGFATGAATLFVLWFLRVLDALPIPR